MVDNSVESNISNRSDFTLVVANGMLQMVESPTEATLLKALSEKDLTKSQISRAASVPITTVAKHIQRMVDKGLVTIVNVEGRDLYRNNTRILLSTDYTRITSTDVGKNVVARMMEDSGDISIYVFSWMLVELESLGTDPSFLATNFGDAVGDLFMKEHHPVAVEELIKELSEFIIERKIMCDMKVVTYLPLTFYSEFKLPFPEYPFHITQFIAVNIVRSVMESYLGTKQYISNISAGTGADGKTSYVGFTITPKYSPESDPWKTIKISNSLD